MLIMHIGFLFSRHISRTQSFQQNRHIVFLALVALKLLVSLISRLVACSTGIVGDRQDTQNDYRNPRYACARRGLLKLVIIILLVSLPDPMPKQRESGSGNF